MLEHIVIKGEYEEAFVYTKNIEEKATAQVKSFLDLSISKGTNVRIMPDVHAGTGCVIGFTAKLTDSIIPNIVGVDIGCGMIAINLGKKDFSLDKLDKLIHRSIPAGMNVHSKPVMEYEPLMDIRCIEEIKALKRIECSIGSLGGGNHFIEVDVDTDGTKYLVIHSGSRNLGKQVADIYQAKAIESCVLSGETKKKRVLKYPRDLCFLTGSQMDDYLYDMSICQDYASLNRRIMGNIIVKGLLGASGLKDFEYFETIHNYVNFEDNIIRKGSISANEGEKVLIPMSMRDGSLICIGKGNPDWNNSAPHGAGRIMSRREAFAKINLDSYKKAMQGIFSTTVNKNTLDEAPFAYKSPKEIIDNIQDTVEVKSVIRPIYNFKAQE